MTLSDGELFIRLELELGRVFASSISLFKGGVGRVARTLLDTYLAIDRELSRE